MRRGNRCHRWVTAAGLLAVSPSGLTAQANQAPLRLWSVSLDLGWPVFGQSSKGIEAAMRAGGFDDPSLGFFGPGAATPHSTVESPSVLLTVRRRLDTTWHLRAMIGHSILGQTNGFNGEAGFGTYLFLKQSVTTYAVMAGFNGKADGSAWVAAGLGFHHVALEHMEANGGPSVTANRLGPVVAGGLAVPAHKRFFFDLQGQYRLVGTVDVPAIPVLGFDGSVAATLPPSEVSFNHGLLSLGFGVRF